MKKIFIAINTLVATTMFVTSCQKVAQVPTSVAEVKFPSEDLTEIKVDSVVTDTVWEVREKEVMQMIEDGEKPSFHCHVEVPVADQNPILANAVMEWVNEACMSGMYDGEKMDVRSMVANYARSVASGKEDGNNPDTQVDIDIRKVYENQYVVTFLCAESVYNFGAPHGQTMIFGATFRKSDGKVFGWNMIRNAANLQPILTAGLQEYFDVKTSAELEEQLMLDSPYSLEFLPKPEVDPWVTKDGIVFLYQSYEIGSYAVGTPTFTVPVKQMKGLLTETAKNIL